MIALGAAFQALAAAGVLRPMTAGPYPNWNVFYILRSCGSPMWSP
jgi:hypothetical protein